MASHLATTNNHPDSHGGKEAYGAMDSKRTVLVAKRMPPDYMGEELHYTNPRLKPIPISILTQPGKGPQRDRDGKIREHTLLGDIEDFTEMDKLYGTPAAAEEPTTTKHDNPQDHTNETDEERQKMEEQRLKEEEAREKYRLERKRWLNRLHIFQRYREVREEHALRNWKRHSLVWQRVERELSKSVDKDPADLLMARLGEYREKLEERDLMEEAMDLLEQRKVNFWSPGLRIGNDLLGLMVTIPQGGPRKYVSDEIINTLEHTNDSCYRLERMVTKEPKHYDPNSKFNTYHTTKRNELKNLIADLDPFSQPGVGGFLEVEGKPLHLASLTSEFSQRLAERSKKLNSNLGSTTEILVQKDSENGSSLPSREGPGTITVAEGINPGTLGRKSRAGRSSQSSSGILKEIQGVHSSQANLNTKDSGLTADATAKKKPEEERLVEIRLAATQMTFEVLLNEVSTSILTVYNSGPTAIHFEWKKVIKENPLKVKAVNDGVQRFFFYHKKGVIPPHSAFDFRIIFKSASPGIFTETWTLQTEPATSATSEKTVTFQGIAIEADVNKPKRDEITHLLDRREATTLAKGIIDFILSEVKPRGAPSTAERRKLLNKNDEYVFITKNSDLKLYYQPKVFEQFEALASQAFGILGIQGKWDGSVQSLNNVINEVEKVEWRSKLLARLNEL
ncbi:hypothetical protein HDV05_006731, partial [Chytridiales sp. JEL 0842]